MYTCCDGTSHCFAEQRKTLLKNDLLFHTQAEIRLFCRQFITWLDPPEKCTDEVIAILSRTHSGNPRLERDREIKRVLKFAQQDGSVSIQAIRQLKVYRLINCRAQ